MTHRSIAEIEADLAAADAAVDAVEARRALIARELHAAKLAAAPVHVGDIVQAYGRFSGEMRVTAVDVRWSGKPWIEASPRRRDGTWGTAKRRLFTSWELVDHHEEADA